MQWYFKGKSQKTEAVSGIRRRKRECARKIWKPLETLFWIQRFPSCQELFNWNKG